MESARESTHATSPSATDREALLAEYQALRAEVLKRVEFQHQLVQLTLLVLGTILAVGVQSKQVAVLLVYPIVGTFLCASWAHNNVGARQLGEWIKVRIESQLPAMGWEGFVGKNMRTAQGGPAPSFDLFSARGMFIGTQLIAIVLAGVFAIPEHDALTTIAGVGIPSYGPLLDVLFVVSALAVLTSLLVLRGKRVAPVPGPAR